VVSSQWSVAKESDLSRNRFTEKVNLKQDYENQTIITSKKLNSIRNCQSKFLILILATLKLDEIKTQVKHIAIAGNIGAGKTTLSNLLAKHYKWDAMIEDTQTNPYLSDFYGDMSRWSFNLQIYFLNSRFQQVSQIQRGDKTVIQDRTIYEDAKIFAPNLYEMDFMSERDFNNYLSLFEIMSSYISPPDLLIYLKSDISTLVQHIQARGRDYEGSINLEYLKHLNEKYNEWIATYDDGNLLIIDIANKDFVKNKLHLGEVIEKIDAELFGLF